MQKWFHYFGVCALAFFLAACAPAIIQCPDTPDSKFIKTPIAPIKPDASLSSLEEVVNTEPLINKFQKSGQLIEPGVKIGVMDFKSSEGSGSGNLVSDTFSIHFFRRNLQVVERENIKKIVEEHKMAAEGLQNLSDEAVARRIGQLTQADFIVFGAVTQYHFENRKLPVPYRIHADEMARYRQAMNQYKMSARSFERARQETDERYYEFIKGDIICQMHRNDHNRGLHGRTEVTQGCGGPQAVYKWNEYASARSLKLEYPYFTTHKVLPWINIKPKELAFKAQVLEQELMDWKATFNDFLKQHDKGVSEERWADAVRQGSGSWNDYISSDKRDNYMKNVVGLAENIVAKLREYHGLKDQLRAAKMIPIPEKEDQFDIPPAVDRFVSVANLGITFKIIDVRTGGIIWIGQASKRDLNIQEGLNVVVEAVVNDILGSNAQ